MNIEELYKQKGEVITQIEILQVQLRNINTQIAEKLGNKDNQTKVVAKPGEKK